MLYPDQEVMGAMRAEDPKGLYSNNAIERAATVIKLAQAIEALPDGDMREILETIVALL